MERIPSKKPDPDKIEGRQRDPRESVRAWRAPESEMDSAIKEFIQLTQYKEIPRPEAFDQVTKDWGDKKTQEFLKALAAIEKPAEANAFSVEKAKVRTPEKKKEAIDEQKVVDALSSFKSHAVDVPSDMPLTFDEVSQNMQLTPAEQNELARRIMGMFTARDIPEEKETAKEDAVAAQAQAVDELLGEHFKRTRAGIQINPDGTAQVIRGRRPNRHKKGNSARS